MEFFEKLVAIQTDLKAPKGQKNSFGGYRYRSCEDILEAVKPLLAKHGLVLNISDEVIEIGGRIYVKARATITDGQNFQMSTAFAREAETKKGMDPAQVTGTSSSYARKYALNGLFCIDDTKDPDTDEYTKRTKGTKEEKPSEISFGTANAEDKDLPFDVGEPAADTSAELLGLQSLMKMDGITEEQVLEAFHGKYSAVENASNEDITKLMNKWQDFVTYIKGGN